jgi:hypothetical protein
LLCVFFFHFSHFFFVYWNFYFQFNPLMRVCWDFELVIYFILFLYGYHNIKKNFNIWWVFDFTKKICNFVVSLRFKAKGPKLKNIKNRILFFFVLTKGAFKYILHLLCFVLVIKYFGFQFCPSILCWLRFFCW